MSGSPVYLDGKLAGALAFRIGEFSKEPIAGVTPIAEMLEINALDNSPAPAPVETKAGATTPEKTSGSRHFEPAATGFRQLFEAYRSATRIQWFFGREYPALCSAVCRRRNCASNGSRLSE